MIISHFFAKLNNYKTFFDPPKMKSSKKALHRKKCFIIEFFNDDIIFRFFFAKRNYETFFDSPKMNRSK